MKGHLPDLVWVTFTHRLGGEQEGVLKGECQYARSRRSAKMARKGGDTFLPDTPFTPLALTMFTVLKEGLGVGGKLGVDGAGLLEAGSRVVVGELEM